MDSRVNKYNENDNMSRVSKNEELYKKINDGELDNFSVRSNATVIGNQDQEIDIEKIKKILDKRYNEAPKRRSIRVEAREPETRVTVDDTKEYDLNVVLEKAKDEKVETYEETRAKKLRNTQFDILNNLQINDEEKEDNDEVKVNKKPEEDLMELINTITINEAKKKEEEKRETDDMDPLDILEDLKGSKDTQVYEKMVTEVKTISENVNKSIQNADEVIQSNKNTLDNSFYTTSNLFKKKDFEDDNNDFLEDSKLNLGIKILIVLVVICFLVGLFLFLKSFIGF